MRSGSNDSWIASSRAHPTTSSQTVWLRSLTGSPRPLVVVVHHYPLGVRPFRWTPNRFDHPANGRASLAGRSGGADGDRRAGSHAVLGCSSGGWSRAGVVRHVHRARLEHRGGIVVGLNGQSGAGWAGRPVRPSDPAAQNRYIIEAPTVGTVRQPSLKSDAPSRTATPTSPRNPKRRRRLPNQNFTPPPA